jgi:phosphopantetheine--protein transferase-like protein
MHLGNDIVDLTDRIAQGQGQDLRFIKRVFSASEQEFIQQHPDDTRLRIVWALWAAKEAAYKACKKQDTDISFSPREFQVQIDTVIDKLQFKDRILFLEWQHHPDWIHCVALLSNQKIPIEKHCASLLDWEKNYCSIPELSEQEALSIYSEESRQVRRYAKTLLAQKTPYSDLEIIRTPQAPQGFGPPQLYLAHQRLPHADISLSHDGQWLAVAWCLE